MKKVSIIPNMITSFGLACGLYVIFRLNMADHITFTVLKTMTIVLIVAAFADVLDGAVARAMRGESEFGLTFDSLCDAISFGVAPSIMFLSTLDVYDGDLEEFLALSAAMIYTICGVLRLVRFNVKQGIDKEEKNKAFIGLPIPAAAMAFVSPNLFFHSPYFTDRFVLESQIHAWVLSVTGIFLAYLMLSKIRFASIKSFHIRLRSFETVFIGSLVALIFLYGFIHNLAALLVCASWGYIILSLLTHPFRTTKKPKRRSKRK